MLTWQSSEINGERSTSQNEAIENFLLKAFIMEIDFTFFETDAEDVNIHLEN